MVDNSAGRLDAVFHALADPTRRSMLEALAREPRKVGQLAEPFDISLAAASKHIIHSFPTRRSSDQKSVV